MRKRKWTIAVETALGIAFSAFFLFVGVFFLIAGVWSFFFGTRIGVMLSPLMLLLGGFLIAAGIIIVLKLRKAER